MHLRMRAVICCGALVACAAPGVAASVDLQFLTWTGGGSAQLENDVMNPFRQSHPDVDINYTTVSGGTTGLFQRLQLLAAGGAGADLTATHTNWSREAASEGLLLDLQPYIKRDHIDLSIFPESILDAYRGPNGELYGLPWQFTTIVLGYDRAAFDRAGQAYPSADWSIFDMEAAAKKFRVDENGDSQPDAWGLGGVDLNDYVWRFWGLSYVSPDGKRSGWHQDEGAAIDAWDWYGKLYTQSLWGGDSATLWNGGKMAMYLGWPHILTQRAPAMTDAWDIQVMPLPARGPRVARAAGAGWSILRSSKHPDEAWEVLKFLISPEAQYQLLVDGRGGISRDALSRFWISSYDPSAIGVKDPRTTLQNRDVMIDGYAYASLDNTPPDYATYQKLINIPLARSLSSGKAAAGGAVPAAIAQIDGMLAGNAPKAG